MPRVNGITGRNLNVLRKRVTTTITLPADSKYNTTFLMIHGDGTNNANNNTFVDSSTNNYSITRSGSTTQGTFTPFSQTGWSTYFNYSNSDILSIADNTALQMSTGAFTIEMWVYPYDSGTIQSFVSKGGNSASGFVLRMNASNQLAIVVGASTTYTYTTTPVTLNAWNHIAYIRDASGNIYVCLNGVISSTLATNAYDFSQTQAMYIGGSRAPNTNMVYGYISNLRIVKGLAVYSGSTYTVPTSPLTAISGSGYSTSLLTFQSNRFVDNSGNNFAISVNSGAPSIQTFSPVASGIGYSTSTVGGSMYFNGSTDYLSINSGNLLNVSSSSNWSLEAWIYPTTIPSGYAHVFFGSGISFGLYTSSLFLTDNNTQIIGGGTLVVNTWYHIALVNVASSSCNLYLNGTRINTTSARSFTSTTTYIGANSSGGQLFTGYIGQARITNTAVYTGTSYTIPTAPLTAITGTQLLISGTNAGILDTTSKNVLYTGSTAKLSTTQSKFGGTSMNFDGSANSVVYSVPSTSTLNPISNTGNYNTGDFTIECWVYAAGSGGFQCFATNRNSAGGAGTWWFGLYTGTLQVVWYNAATATLISNAITANAWHHVAVSRSSGTIKMFVDGTLTGTSSAADTTNYSVGMLSIGYSIVEAGYGFTGYIDELRISRTARYTAAFTPPTTAFVDY